MGISREHFVLSAKLRTVPDSYPVAFRRRAKDCWENGGKEATFLEFVLPITLRAPLISFPKSSESPLFRRLKATGYESGTVQYPAKVKAQIQIVLFPV